MKRLLTWILLGALALSFGGCAAASAPVETVSTVPTEVNEAAKPIAEATQETEPAVLEDSLFLKVSSITFSLVGENDDIYLGMIPRELVTWESEDPNVVSVENGVLTATGVGTTTIRATYYDREVTCTAGCLAQTQEELEALDVTILREPKRMPPQVDLTEPCTYFDNAAIVGDSITYIMSQRESKTNYLGNITFLARGGVSINGFVRHYKNIYFRGKEQHLENAIAASKVERVYFLMGSNDVGSSGNRVQVFDNWIILLERIREKRPDIEIVLLSNTPIYDKTSNSDDDNDLIEEYNKTLRQFAADNDCMYLDLHYYIEDHNGRMAKVYSQDHYHLNEAGCETWVRMMRHYLQYESEGGTLS